MTALAITLCALSFATFVWCVIAHPAIASVWAVLAVLAILFFCGAMKNVGREFDE